MSRKSAAQVCALLSVSALASAVPPDATQLPTGGQVVAGQASIAQSGARMEVTQTSARGVVNWNTFNVGAQAQVNFKQSSANSVTLNRVLDSNASQIFGRITANGQVFLTNPNGVYFSPSASVNVGGLVATTHTISNADFMAGKNNFARAESSGSVINEGELKAALGGYIALLAPEVRNNGVIVAQLGTVALAAGENITLNFDGNGTLAGITVTPAQINSLVENRQAVLAPGGLIILSAQAANSLQGGVVKNSGRLEAVGLAMRGGKILLEASTRVENTGRISSDAGNASTSETGAPLAAGPAGSITIKAPQIINAGELTANTAITLPNGNAGQILLEAQNISQTATGRMAAINEATAVAGSIVLNAVQDIQLSGSVDVSANYLTSAFAVTGYGGEISLQAGRQVKLENAVLDASGAEGGGRIHVEGGKNLPALPPQDQPNVAFLGNTDARVNSRRGMGGRITVVGENIALLDDARVEATGATGGGAINIGGGWQGSGNIRQSTTVTIGNAAMLNASATDNGDGGTIVLWSDVKNRNSQTRVHGVLLAKGGVQGGNGGRIETSGHWLDVAGITANASAAQGKGGEWLLDPIDVTITTGADANGFFSGGVPNVWTPNATASNILNTTIETALNAGTSVTISTTGGLGEAGNITVSANISKTFGGDATLLLKAHNDIVVSPNVQISSILGKLHVTLNSDSDASGAGAILLNTGSSISSLGGNIVMGGGTDPTTGYAVGDATYFNGVLLAGTTALTSSGGNISIRGKSSTGNTVAVYTGIRSFATINSGAGTITLDGIGQGTGSANTQSVTLDSASSITSANTAANAISITGAVIGSNNVESIGINAGGTIQTTNGGGITLSGTGGTTTAAGGAWQTSDGISLYGDILSNGGPITLTGTKGSAVNGSVDMRIYGGTIGGLFLANSSSPITLNANTVSLSGNAIQSSGTLTIAPRTAGTTIGLGSGTGTGTLLLPQSYFWNGATGIIKDGFFGITIGSTTTGNIDVNALTFSDNLTLWAGNANATAMLSGAIANAGTVASSGSLTVKAAGDIVGSLTTITTQNQSVVLNSDLDGINGGGISMYGTTINSNGGNITLGGGASGDGTGYTGGLSTTANYNAGGNPVSKVGIGIGNSTLNAAGGNISLRGQGYYDGVTQVTRAKGVELVGNTGANVSISTTGIGTITLDGKGAADPGGINYGVNFNNSTGNGTISVGSQNGAITIVGVGGNGGNNNNVGVKLEGASGSNLITTTGGAINITGTAGAAGWGTSGIDIAANSAIGDTFTTGAMTLTADTAVLSGTFRSAGALTVKPLSAATTIGIAGGAGTLALSAANFSSNFVAGFSGITIGNATSGAITIGGTLSANDNLAFVSGGTININAPISVLNNKSLMLDASTSENGAGSISAGGLTLFGTNHNLTASSNNVARLAANMTGNLSFVNSGALIIDGVGGFATAGTIDISTLTGDLTIMGGISTSNGTAAAILLNAGKSTAAGIATGGNIVFAGVPGFAPPPSPVIGVGGRATLMTGSVANSIIGGVGAGNFRYNSDEVTANYSLQLGQGFYAIYREQPILTVTPSTVSSTYGGAIVALTSYVATGYVNGDTSLTTNGVATFSTNVTNTSNAGAYNISYTGGLSNSLGYAIVDAIASVGEYHITPKNLTVSANSAIKTYDGVGYVGGNGVTYNGFVNGESVAVLGGALSYGGSSQNAINAGSYLITPGGYTSGNYAISYVDGTLTVNAMVPVLPPIFVPPPVSLPPIDINFPPPDTGGLPNTSSLPAGQPVTPATGNSSPVNTTSTPSVNQGGGVTPPPTVIPPSTSTPVLPARTITPDTGGAPRIQPTNTGTSSSGTSTPATNEVPNNSTPPTETVTNTLAKSLGGALSSGGSGNTLDGLASSQVQSAINKGMNPVQAKLAGDAFTKVLTQQLSQGKSMPDAMTRAQQVFQTEANLPASSPTTVAAGNIASGNSGISNQLAALANTKTASGSSAFDRALASALAKGLNFSDAVKVAQTSAQLADSLAQADNTPQSMLANGNAAGGLSNTSERFQLALGNLLAQGYSLGEANQRAAQLMNAEILAASVDAANPNSGLASGNLTSLTNLSTEGDMGMALSAALARGLPMNAAMERMLQLNAAEKRAVEVDAQNPTASFSSGKVAPRLADAAFDQAMTNALARGETPSQAIASAGRATSNLKVVKPTLASALASGQQVDSILFGEGSSKTYRAALGNALARGLPLAQAIEIAKRADNANAFRFPLPANVANQIVGNNSRLSVLTAEGKLLPPWIRFDPKQKQFISNEVPVGGLPLPVTMRLGQQQFTIEIKDGSPRGETLRTGIAR